MGCSPSAYMVYGIFIEDDSEMPWVDEDGYQDFEDWYMRDVLKLKMHDDFPQGNYYECGAFEANKKAFKASNIDLLTMFQEGCGQYLIKADSEISAHCWDHERFQPSKLNNSYPEWDTHIKQLCTDYGIDYVKPKWFLVGDYG